MKGHRQPDIVEIEVKLLNMAMETDLENNWRLHLAAWSGHAEIVSYLCNNKADVGASAMDDTGAIHFASQKGHIEVVRILLSFGVSIKSINRKGMTPLHFAIQGSHIELVKYLIRKGANLSSKNKTGETPLDLIKSEEMRSLINELEQSLKNKDQTTSSGTDEFPLKPSNAEDVKDVHALSSCDQVDTDLDTDEKREKRKGDDDDITQDSLPVPDAKKSKVSLAHLLAEDDIEEEL
ncbi:ankyrin-1-like [Dendrobium catenatum]|uniref:ankyrin-1-like n=1 Tax=Dendrobium catenatum TaxID=906689 RepID=UPI0010A08228|nr:ankyrin-1-like [Dendrobium catenatum]